MPVGAACGLSARRRPVPIDERRLQHPLSDVLAEVHAGSCPGDLNFHCHTTCSDGSLLPEQLGEQALAIGLRHFSVTDHHSVAAHGALARWLDERRQQGVAVPVLWSGVEVSCLLEGCLVHVLALGFELDHEAMAPYTTGSAPVGPALQASEVRRRIHAANGLALLAHPARYRLPFQRLIEAAAALGFDGAEAFYDYGMQARWQPTPLVCDAVDALLGNLGLLRSCGTDTHGLQLSGR